MVRPAVTHHTQAAALRCSRGEACAVTIADLRCRPRSRALGLALEPRGTGEAHATSMLRGICPLEMAEALGAAVPEVIELGGLRVAPVGIVGFQWPARGHQAVDVLSE